MREIAVALAPSRDIVGIGPRWTALSNEPWFSLKTEEPLAGRWIKIRWRSGLLDPVCRPVLRCTTSDGPLDIIFAAAIFGANEWIGYVPDKTGTVGLSPTNNAGEFGFELEKLCFISTLDLFKVVFSRAPRLGFLALGAWFIRRKNDMFHIIRDAIATQRLSHYARWRRNRLRHYDPAGIDGVLCDAARRLHVRFIVDLREAEPTTLSILIDNLKDQSVDNWSVAVVASPSQQNSVKWSAFRCHSGIRFLSSSARYAEMVQEMDDADLITSIPPTAILAEMTVATVLAAAARSPEASLFYGDTDRLSDDGERCEPNFKPGFDPILQQRLNSVGAFGYWRVRTLKSVDTIEKSFSNLLPDPTLVSKAVAISRVLLTLPAAYTQEPINSDGVAPDSIDADATIIIPTRDRIDLLQPCVDSILRETLGKYRIIVVDNGSVEPATFKYFAKIAEDTRVIIKSIPGPFNFARLCNTAAKLTSAEILVFLNNDTSVIRADWLLQLKRYVHDPKIGAVGAKLLYPTGKVQHAGVTAGMGGQAGHFEQGSDQDAFGYFHRAQYPHLLSAVTGACLAVERSKFEEVGGFDEVNLPIDLNDIDLCFRLAEHGYQTLLMPESVMIHHESASRGHPNDTERLYTRERTYFRQRWLRITRADPYFSPALSLYAREAMLG